MFRIPSIIKNQGEEIEELTTLRREKWISAISRGDTAYKDILQSERVCGRHFVSGRPAQHWDKHNVDWIPTLNLGKKGYTERNSKAATERAERAKARRRSAIEQQELEAAKKRKLLNESGTRVVSIDFSENAASTSDKNADIQKAENVQMIESEPEDASNAFAKEELELQQDGNMAARAETQTEAFDHLYRKTNEHQAPDKDAETQTRAFDYLYRKTSEHQAPDRNAETQTEEFDYLFLKSSGYQAPVRDFFKSDERVRFYTGLPSYEVLVVVFEHVISHVTRRTQSLDRFQEFVMFL